MSLACGATVALALTGSGWGSVAAAQPSFTSLGDLPGGTFYSIARGVSSDGSVVVGTSLSSRGTEAFRWTAADGMIGLGDLPGGPPFSFDFYSEAYSVSGDGGTVAGVGRAVPGNEPTRWMAPWQGGGSGPMGLLGFDGGETIGAAFAVSADGATIVGSATPGANAYEAFRWRDGIMTGLGDLDGGIVGSRAFGVSADGSVVVGFGSTDDAAQAFRWTQATGMLAIPDLAGSAEAVAFGVSADGSTAVGYSRPSAAYQAWRWTATTGTVALPPMADGSPPRIAYACSGDGALVVGRADTGFGQEAFLWDSAHGTRRLKDIFLALQLPVDDWILSSCTCISRDGTALAGFGFNPSGQTEAWVARIPGVCRADVNGDGSVNVQDFLVYLQAFAAADSSADLNGDGSVTVQDFLVFLNLYGLGCS
jgi:probable HAF family extracellular repeat protein